VIVLVNWYFFFSKKKIFKISQQERDLQEVKVVVKGGYTPDIIVVKKGGSSPRPAMNMKERLTISAVRIAKLNSSRTLKSTHRKKLPAPKKLRRKKLNNKANTALIIKCRFRSIRGYS